MSGINAWLDNELSFRVGSAIAQLHMGALLKTYQALSGSGRIIVLPFELLRSDPSTFIDSMSAFLGVDAAEMRTLNEQGILNRTSSKQRISVIEACFVQTLRHLVNRDYVAFREAIAAFEPRIQDAPALGAIREAFDRRETDYAIWCRLMRTVIPSLDLSNPEAIAPSPDQEINEANLAKIASIARQTNRILQTQFNVDLGAHGYAL